MAYATIAEVRALDSDLADTSLFPDTRVTEATTWAAAVIDGYTGTSFEYKAFTVKLEPRASDRILLPVLFLRTLTSVKLDGVEQTPDATWILWDYGEVKRPTGSFYAVNVVEVSGTAGFSAAAPPEIAWAARTLAGQYLKDLVSRIPDRALQVQSDFGPITVAQAGGLWRPTSLPDVNAVLNRHRHRPPALG